jgi:hypothetical protein
MLSIDKLKELKGAGLAFCPKEGKIIPALPKQFLTRNEGAQVFLS